MNFMSPHVLSMLDEGQQDFSHLFRKPFVDPPPTLGLQFFQWGNGGPRGDLHIKGSTPRPWPSMTNGTFGTPCDWHTKFNALPMTPQGVPTSRPVAQFNNATADPVSMAIIVGLMKGGTPAQVGGQ